jgi:hypothetical protein
MKTTLALTVVLVIEHKDDVDPIDVVNECTYCFDSLTDGAAILDSEITDAGEIL